MGEGGEDARDPTASRAKGEIETKSTLQVGLARESAVLSLLPAVMHPWTQFPHLCMRRQHRVTP